MWLEQNGNKVQNTWSFPSPCLLALLPCGRILTLELILAHHSATLNLSSCSWKMAVLLSFVKMDEEGMSEGTWSGKAYDSDWPSLGVLGGLSPSAKLPHGGLQSSYIGKTQCK
jgi:hypothetical protein